MDGLTTKEAAERLGIPVTTLKTWLSQLPIPQDMDSRGRRRLTDDAIAVLETVKHLRDEDRGYQTIRRLIRPETDGGSSETGQGPTSDEYETDVGPSPVSTAAIVEAVTAAIATQTDLAEKYARAAHQIGNLEAKVQAKDERIAQLADELAEARQRIALLEAPKETPAPRPWWKWWQGDKETP